MIKKRPIQDLIYSFLSVGIAIGILQLVVYPYLARSKTVSEYGATIATIGVITAVYQTFGGALSQTRLIRNSLYDESGDFPVLISGSCIFVAIIVGVLTIIFWKGGIKNGLLNIAFGVISTINAYAIVAFRVKINYQKFFLSNTLVGIGYIVGIVFNIIISDWQIIFISAQVFLLVYLYFRSGIFQEAFRISSHFKISSRTYLWLLVSCAMANSVQYLDKFLVYPILGGESSSLFFVATFFAKSFSMIILPVDNVLLSYLASGQVTFTKKKFLLLVLLTLIACLAFSLIIFLFAVPVTKLLYPTLIDRAIPFIAVSNVAILLGIAYGIIGLPVLVYAPTYWQFVLNVAQLLIYLSSALIFTNIAGLLGFCFAMLLSNLLRVVISIVISLVYIEG